MDPLAQLSDIHLPEQIPNYPIAIGWWLLAAFIIILLSVIIIKIKHYQAKRQAKTIALQQLKQQPNMPIHDILMLLKWAAMQYFPRHHCANLYGKSLQDFLVMSLPEKYQTAFSALLSKAKPAFEQAYQADGEKISDSNLYQMAIFWLTHALPPKKDHNLTGSEVKL